MSFSSSSSPTLLTTCCICLSRMKEPIRTLPCLHSSCASCIDQLIIMGKRPFKCPQCRSPFDPPSSSSSSASASASSSTTSTASSASASDSLEANSFTSHLLLASAPNGSTSHPDDFDPNNIKCGFCEENEAEEYCKDCPMFYCAGCKRGHLRQKPTSHHQFVSIDEGLEMHLGGSLAPFAPSGSSPSTSSSSSTTRITRCRKHPHLEVNSFCDKCKKTCCAECSVDNHSGHEIVRLASISEQFKGEIITLINKVKDYDHPLSQTIKKTADVLGRLKDQGQIAEEHVHQVFRQLRLQLDEREAELIGDVSQEMHQKEKELMIQKDELEFLVKGIRDSVEFGDRLVREGNGVEIVLSHKAVIGRFHTLENEFRRTPMTPVTDEVIEFLGGESGVEESQRTIKGIGSIVVKGTISVEKSCVVRSSDGEVIPMNQNYSFNLVVVDQRESSLSGMVCSGAIEVKIDGPSKDVKVDLVEQAGNEGKASGSFKLSEIGKHVVSILFRGSHLQGSPFRLKVIERPVYRRDYTLVGDQPVVKIGSKGYGDGQISSPSAVVCNWRGEIIVADQGNHRIQVFDQNGKFLFKFGSRGCGNGQLNHPYGVTVDHRNQSQIVVSDGQNHRIQVFDEKGGFLRSFGNNGRGDGQFSCPFGIAVDQTNGNYFVVDHANHRVQVFDSAGRFIRKFGSEGNRSGMFNHPLGIGLLSNGNIVVSEWSGDRLQIFDSTGTFLRVISGLKNPYHVFIDSDDNILVPEYGNGRAQLFKENGSNVRTIGKKQLSNPRGVCMDDQGRIIFGEEAGRLSFF